ncbi:MAG TPA: CBS domain-containing protein [Kofleriaceae bacterium]|jgi:CBS domain-containing protein|nr:CBS domain-containing protein [Kofleriaceae bacterium]
MRKISDIMCKDPETIARHRTVREAAVIMKERDIGDVLVVDEDGRLCGIVTDRDIVVRGLAEGRDLDETPIGDLCSGKTITLALDADFADAVAIMREHAIRRVPIVENGEPIGIVSIGDLAREGDPRSALAEISAAPPNA